MANSKLAQTKPVDKSGNALSGLSCDRVERIWHHKCTQASKTSGFENEAKPLGQEVQGSALIQCTTWGMVAGST